VFVSVCCFGGLLFCGLLWGGVFCFVMKVDGLCCLSLGGWFFVEGVPFSPTRVAQKKKEYTFGLAS